MSNPYDTGHSIRFIALARPTLYPPVMTKRNQPRADADTPFDAPVSILLDGHRIVIADAMQAHACLLRQFADRAAPSYVRALNTCEAFLAGTGKVAGVQATFVVAVMEAGISFEVQDIDLRLLESDLDNLLLN